MTIILLNLNRFTNFFTGRFFGKFAVKCILKIPLHLAYVATLPCETLMSEKTSNLRQIAERKYNGYYVTTDVTVGQRSFCLHTFGFFVRIKCF